MNEYRVKYAKTVLVECETEGVMADSEAQAKQYVENETWDWWHDVKKSDWDTDLKDRLRHAEIIDCDVNQVTLLKSNVPE